MNITKTCIQQLSPPRTGIKTFHCQEHALSTHSAVNREQNVTEPPENSDIVR